MKRSEVKRRPLADTVLATLEPEGKVYRVLDGDGLYFRVKPSGAKSWELRYKTPAGKWSWYGIGSYTELSGAKAREEAVKVRTSRRVVLYKTFTRAFRKALVSLSASSVRSEKGRISGSLISSLTRCLAP